MLIIAVSLFHFWIRASALKLIQFMTFKKLTLRTLIDESHRNWQDYNLVRLTFTYHYNFCLDYWIIDFIVKVVYRGSSFLQLLSEQVRKVICSNVHLLSYQLLQHDKVLSNETEQAEEHYSEVNINCFCSNPILFFMLVTCASKETWTHIHAVSWELWAQKAELCLNFN